MKIDIESAVHRRKLESKMRSRQEAKDKGVVKQATKRSPKIGELKGSSVAYKTIKANSTLDQFEVGESNGKE